MMAAALGHCVQLRESWKSNIAEKIDVEEKR